MKRALLVILSFLLLSSPSLPQSKEAKQKLLTGADRLLSEFAGLVKGKRIGLVTNESGILSNGMPLVDALYKTRGFEVTALFGPEHGIRGAAPAGSHVDNSIDPCLFALR